MSSFYVEDFVGDGGGAVASANLYVTIAGNVKAPNGAGIVRTVAAFADGDLTRQLGQGDSSLPSGAFSFLAPGIETTKITVIAKSEAQENSVIYARCSVVGGGAGYTPPPIDNIQFYVGNGETTTPYCDIYHQMSSIEAEAVNQAVINADFGLMSRVEAVAINANVINCDINHPMASISAVSVSFTMAYGNIAPPMSRVEAYGINANVINVTINHRMSSIESECGADVDIYNPMSRIESVAVNPSTADCTIHHRMSKINSDLETIRLTSISLLSPGALMAMDGTAEGNSTLSFIAPGAIFSLDGSAEEDNEISLVAPAAMFSLSSNQTEKYGVVKNIRGEIR